MSALSFYTRPTYFCAHCGSVAEHEVDIEVDSGSTRSIWCNYKSCDQYRQRVRVQDPIHTLVSDKTQVQDDRTLPLLQEPVGQDAGRD